jgi:DNA-binding LacI/PurR family transcriptional regulator
VAAMSDRLALGALQASAEPVRVSGWDDSEVARRHQLTTVAQSMRDQGAACALTALGKQAPGYRDAWRVVRRASTEHDPAVSSTGSV